MCSHTPALSSHLFLSPISNTKVAGFGSTHRKRRFLREQAIGPGSFERVIIVKCQVNSEGLSSSNWEQISADGDIFNTGLPGQSETAGISQIPSLICLLTERSVSAHCFSFKMCFSPHFFYLWQPCAGNQVPFISELNIQHLKPTSWESTSFTFKTTFIFF